MSEIIRCAECGMQVEPGEYHPYAACLMFKACQNADTVRGNLQDVAEHGAKRAEYVISLLIAAGVVSADKVAQAREITTWAKPEHGEG